MNHILRNYCADHQFTGNRAEALAKLRVTAAFHERTNFHTLHFGTIGAAHLPLRAVQGQEKHGEVEHVRPMREGVPDGHPDTRLHNRRNEGALNRVHLLRELRQSLPEWRAESDGWT